MTQPVQDQYPNQTRWTNNTDKPVKVRIRLGPKRVRAGNRDQGIPPKVVHPGYEDYVWEPGATLFLPSMYDRAIQEMDASGKVVIAGLAPQLTKDGVRPNLHEAIDTAAQEEKLAAQTAEAALQARARADAALSTAGQKIAAAGDRKESERLREELEAERKRAAAAEAKAEAAAKKRLDKGSDDTSGKGG